MFLKIPIERENEVTEENEQVEIRLNPFHIIGIEPHHSEKNQCIVWITGSEVVTALISPARMEHRIKNFMQENVLQRIYKEMQSGNN